MDFKICVSGREDKSKDFSRRGARLAVFAVNGQGDPNGSQGFKDRVEARSTASFTLKFALRKNRGVE